MAAGWMAAWTFRPRPAIAGQAAARASYWFLVDCGPGLYSEPEFGPIAAKMTGDLDAEAAPGDVDAGPAVDAVMQALALTDVVVGAAVTALLLALVVQVHKRAGTLDPDQLRATRD